MLLIVSNAYVHDAGKGTVRVHPSVMGSIGVSDDDVIEIIGNKRTIAKIQKLDPSDENKDMIRMDGMVQYNAGVTIDETVSIRKVDAIPAEKIIVVPLESIPPIDDKYLVDALNGIPLVKGDHVMISYFGGKLVFQVIDVMPQGEAVIVSKNTLFRIEKGHARMSVENQSNNSNEDRFNEHVGEMDRIELGVPKDALLLGYSHFILYTTKDGKLDFGLSGGGYWPDEMRPHMDDSLIKALRNFYYEYRKKMNARFGSDSFKTREFDYEI